MLAELIVLLFLLPLCVVAVLAFADLTVLPGILPPSSWGRQFLRWLGAAWWRCAGLVVTGFGVIYLYAWWSVG